MNVKDILESVTFPPLLLQSRGEGWGNRETLSHCDTVLFVVGKSNLSFQKSIGKMKLLRDFFPLRVKFAIGQEKVASDP